MTTNFRGTAAHVGSALAALALAGVFWAVPASAESDYDTVVSQLDSLQQLAESYISENNTQDDPIQLTLSYTRVGEYNSSIWQMTAGTRDADFEGYVAQSNGDLINLQGLNTITLPNGEGIDFGHLLASMNLVYNGIPISGSWGGDCMQMAQAYAGQASDAAGYAALMQQTFNINDDGTASKFGDQDLRADLDSVVIGASLSADSSVAQCIRDYYADLSDYDRCYHFISLSYGSVDTGGASFPDTVYNALINDTGMQLLLFMNNMWDQDSWTVSPDAEPALRGATNEFAAYLAQAVNNEKVKSDSKTLMMTMDSDALAQALAALGYGDAATSVAANGGAAVSAGTASGGVSGAVDTALNDATQTLKGKFNVSVFQIVLFVLGGAAGLLLIFSVVMILRHRR